MRTYADRRCPIPPPCGSAWPSCSVDDLRTAYEWSRPQEEALYELERHYSAALPRTEASGRAPRDGRREGLAWLAEFAWSTTWPGSGTSSCRPRAALNTLQVVHRRARRIVELPCIATDPAVSVGRRILTDLLEGKVVLVDVSGLGGTEEVLVASYLTRRVLEEWQSAFLSDPERHKQLPVVAVALEEAQRVLSANKDRESNVFPRVAREGRKFGVGLLAVTQQPKLLDDELLSQFNTFFVLGLADEKDRNILRSSAKQDLSALGPGNPDPHARRVPAGKPRSPLRRARPRVPLRRARAVGAAGAGASGRGPAQRVFSRGLSLPRSDRWPLWRRPPPLTWRAGQLSVPLSGQNTALGVIFAQIRQKTRRGTKSAPRQPSERCKV